MQIHFTIFNHIDRQVRHTAMDDLSASEKLEIATLIQSQEKQLGRKLTSNRNKIFAISAIRTLHEQIDALTEKIKNKPGLHFDCKAGCSYCCSLRVAAVPAEIFLIARHLKQLPAEAQTEIIERLKIHAEAARGLVTEDHFLPCPMLADGRCTIYAVRPAMCRKYLSMNVEECKKPDACAAEDREMAMMSSALIFGTGQAYSRAKLSNQIHELGQALLVALTDPTAEDRWHRGGQVFV
jgi:Fe-S-cluster containining protein